MFYRICKNIKNFGIAVEMSCKLLKSAHTGSENVAYLKNLVNLSQRTINIYIIINYFLIIEPLDTWKFYTLRTYNQNLLYK